VNSLSYVARFSFPALDPAADPLPVVGLLGRFHSGATVVRTPTRLIWSFLLISVYQMSINDAAFLFLPFVYFSPIIVVVFSIYSETGVPLHLPPFPSQISSSDST